MTSRIDLRPACWRRVAFRGGGFYLSHGLVPVCEIELSHIGTNNGYSDLVCQKGWMSNEFCIYAV